MSIISKFNRTASGALTDINGQKTALLGGATRALGNSLSKFKGSEAILPVILIESCVTSGRTYQAYKRGGKTEARERFIEQGTSGIVWLFGVQSLNKLGDFIGEKLFGMKGISADVGRDALRQPFMNTVAKNKQLPTAIFKTAKMFASIAIATTFIGFILPKMINKSTSKKLEQKQQNNGNSLNIIPNIDEYIKTNKKTAKDLTFTSGGGGLVNGLLMASHNLEHNTACRLLSTDVGIVTGRTINARNKYEARELFFRDVSSIYFYLFGAAHMFKGLNKISNNKFLNKLPNNKDIHPKALMETADFLIAKLPDKNGIKYGGTMSIEQFREGVLQAVKIPEGLFAEGTVKKLGIKDIIKNFFKGEIENDIISLKEFEEAIQGRVDSAELLAKAQKMAELQPTQPGATKLLSKMQVIDILSDKKWTSDPDFLKKIMSAVTKGKSDKLNKFVSKKELEKVRLSIDEFGDYVLRYAENKGLENIDATVIKKLAKRSLAFNSLFTAAGIITSGIALAVVIPKLQRLMTKKATGKDEFPGTAKY